MNRQTQSILTGLTIIGLILSALVGVIGLRYVAPGEVDVVYDGSGGELYQETGGYYWVVPLVEFKTTYNVQTQTYDIVSEGISADAQLVIFNVTISWYPEYAHILDIHSQYGRNYADKFIPNQVLNATKAVTGQYKAVNIPENIDSITQEIENRIGPNLAKWHIIVSAVSITDRDFSPDFNDQAERTNIAIMKVEEEQHNTNRLREVTNQTIILAEAEAAKKNLETDASAYAIRTINQELSSSPHYLQYLWITEWDGDVPMVVGGQDNSLLLQLPGTLS